MIGSDPKSLRRHYRHELDHGHAKANAKVAENLFRKATGDGRESVTAAIFWRHDASGIVIVRGVEVAFAGFSPVSPVTPSRLFAFECASRFWFYGLSQ